MGSHIERQNSRGRNVRKHICRQRDHRDGFAARGQSERNPGSHTPSLHSGNSADRYVDALSFSMQRPIEGFGNKAKRRTLIQERANWNPATFCSVKIDPSRRQKVYGPPKEPSQLERGQPRPFPQQRRGSRLIGVPDRGHRTPDFLYSEWSGLPPDARECDVSADNAHIAIYLNTSV